jgi:hypothetical protein
MNRSSVHAVRIGLNGVERLDPLALPTYCTPRTFFRVPRLIAGGRCCCPAKQPRRAGGAPKNSRPAQQPTPPSRSTASIEKNSPLIFFSAFGAPAEQAYLPVQRSGGAGRAAIGPSVARVDRITEAAAHGCSEIDVTTLKTRRMPSPVSTSTQPSSGDRPTIRPGTRPT